MESDVIGQLLSAAGPDGKDTEGQRRRKKAGDSDSRGSDCLDRRNDEVRTTDRTTLSSQFVWLSSRPIRIGCGGQARRNCWEYDWVLDLDVRGFFDNLDWELLM